MADQANLTKAEAEARARVLSVPTTTVHLDLSEDDGGDARTFRSRSILDIEVRESTTTFLDLVAAELLSLEVDGAPVEAPQVSAGHVELPMLTPGPHRIVVEAVMRYSRDGRGLHRFVDPTDGVVYLHSQFEPFHALQVFACFDQPDLKTSFVLTVDAPAGWVVVSNEPATSAPNDGAAGRWCFAPTPRISTYLTAIVAGGYVSTQDRYERADGTHLELALYVRRSLREHLEHDELIELTRAGLAYFERTFGRYPFTKYDQLFVPEFSAGAMENPGAVTFTESYVFRSKVTDAVRERRAETILHEMAHMWFGDLVTMRWWDDLWLNESFATFMSVLAMVEATRWTDAWVTFLDAEKSWAKFQDQLPSTHPVADAMPDVESVHQNFDGITYAKGASVLRQLVAWVGQDAFLAGCRNYFETHAWGNTTLADFLAALEHASGRELTQWRDEWLRTTGVNLLVPDIELRADGTYGSVIVRQEDPAPLWRMDGHEPVLRRHRIAVGVYARTADGISRTERVEVDIEGAETSVDELVGLPAGDLLLLNDDDLTFARIGLDDRSLATVTDDLHRIVDPLPRALVWAAAWDMLRDGALPASTFITLLTHNLRHDEQVGVVQRLQQRAIGAVERYAHPGHRDRLRSVVRAHAFEALRRSAPSSDHQLAWFRHWASVADDATDLDRLEASLDGAADFEGLVMDADLRWHVITALARSGRIGEDTIAAERRRDDTDLGHRQSLTALAVRPSAAAKEAAWSALLDDADLSHTLARHLWGGFNQMDQTEVLLPYAARYFEALDRVWRDRTLDFAIEFATGMFPHSTVEQGLLAATDASLRRTDLPKPLRRVLLEQRDTVVRTMRAREVDAAVD